MTIGNPIRVLLIEDNLGDARLIRRMLADAAGANGQAPYYNVVWAERLATGLALLAQDETDIVLCDLSLPDSSGLETPRAVQNAAPALPVIVMTSQDDEENAVAAVQSGAQDYLVKGQVTAQMLGRSIRYARERKRTLAQLFRYSAELEQRNAELDAFAHTVAHDLKNPVAAVIGLAGLLLDQQVQVDAAERTEILNDILQTGHTMYNIIQELMLLAQVNRAKVELAPLPMLDLIRSARHRLAQMSQEYQAEILLEAPERWPIAIGYGAWVEEVWVNYLSNALKYGGQPPQVTIGGELLEENWARFWVRDQGPGIPLAMQPKLFVEFTQLSQARVQGHGLGLSIVRRIVEKLGGRAGVESQPGQGSTFYFVLPAAAH
jgi:two-component system sensor histidine kinase/response regulator